MRCVAYVGVRVADSVIPNGPGSLLIETTFDGDDNHACGGDSRGDLTIGGRQR